MWKTMNNQSHSLASVYDTPGLPKIEPTARDLLERYSKLKPDEIAHHVKAIVSHYQKSLNDAIYH